MNCCCDAIDTHFGEDHARDDLKRYNKNGPDSTTAALLKLLRGENIDNARLLDIGSGIGVIPLELLDDGTVGSATLVDASSSYLEIAESEAVRKFLDDRLHFIHGDFLDASIRLENFDLVTLDRVVCCYPHFEPLVSRSVSKARRWYALSFPRDRWYVRLGIFLENGLRRLKGNPFRSFLHDPDRIRELVEEAGFSLKQRERGAIWQIELYRKDQER